MIDSASGSALAGAKFNFEVLPAGSGFPLRLQLTVYDRIPHKLRREDLLDAFGRLLLGFGGEIALGGHSRRGLGRGGVKDWTVRRFGMAQRTDALAWLEHRGWGGGGDLTIEQLLKSKPLPAADRLSIHLTLALKGPILIRGGVAGTGNPDVLQFREKGQALIPGSSLAGALRHRAERIATKLWGAEASAEAVSELFGPMIEQTRKLRAGRLQVSEGVLRNGKLEVQSRVKIDRFTGGSIETALFDEAPFWPDPSAASHCDFTIALDAESGPDRYLIALLLQTVKDLWLGDLPLGGEIGHGRGVLEGRKATIRYAGSNDVTLTRTGQGGAVEVTGWNREWADRVEGGLHGNRD